MNEPLLEAQHIIKRNEWAYDEVIDTFNNADVTSAHTKKYVMNYSQLRFHVLTVYKIYILY